MPFVALAAVGLGLAGSYMQSRATRRAGDAAAAAANMQADMFMRQADIAERQSSEGVIDFRRRIAELRSQQRASYAAQGVDLSSSVVQQQLTNTDVLSERDAARMQYQAALEAWGLQTQAAMTRTSGQMQAVAARSQSNAIMLSGIGNAAYGAVRAYGMM